MEKNEERKESIKKMKANLHECLVKSVLHILVLYTLAGDVSLINLELHSFLIQNVNIQICPVTFDL